MAAVVALYLHFCHDLNKCISGQSLSTICYHFGLVNPNLRMEYMYYTTKERSTGKKDVYYEFVSIMFIIYNIYKNRRNHLYLCLKESFTLAWLYVVEKIFIGLRILNRLVHCSLEAWRALITRSVQEIRYFFRPWHITSKCSLRSKRYKTHQYDKKEKYSRLGA